MKDNEWKSMWEIQYVCFLTTISDFNPETHFSTSDKGEASNVTIDGTMISALPGGNGGDGGNGHSGGGGGPDDMCYGGSNGSDGECSNGGKGTGEDLATFNFKNFDISPGDGGKYFIYSTGQEFIWRSQNIFMILLLYNSMNQFFIFGGDCKSATKIIIQ